MKETYAIQAYNAVHVRPALLSTVCVQLISQLFNLSELVSSMPETQVEWHWLRGLTRGLSCINLLQYAGPLSC